MSAQKQTTVISVFRAFVITVILLITVMFGTGYLFVNQAGGLSRLLEIELTKMVGSGTATVGDARVRISLSRQPLQLTASNLEINLDSEKINLPSADMRFGLSSILQGRPEIIVLRGLKLDLVKKTVGWSGSPAILFLDSLGKNYNRTQLSSDQFGNAHNRLGGVKLIAIETDRLSLSHEAGKLPNLIFENIYIDVTSDDDGEISGSMRAMQLDEAGGPAGSIAVSFDGWPGSKKLKIDLSASELKTSGIGRYIEGLPYSFSQIRKLSGHLGLKMENSLITSINADLALMDGVLGVPGISRDAAFDNADLVFTYDRTNDNLTVSKAKLKMLDKRQLSFTGTVSQFHASSSNVSGMIEANNLSVQSLLDDWPEALAPELKTMIINRFNGGQFKTVKAVFEGIFESQTSALNLSKLNLESEFSAVRANLSNDQYQRLVATIGGALGMTMGKGGIVKEVLVDLSIKDGSMLVAGYDGSIDLPSGQLKSALSGNKMALEHLAMDFGSAGKFNLNGVLAVGDAWSLQDLKLDLSVPDMDARLFSALWPNWATPEVRQWVFDKVPTGRVSDSKLSIAADLGAAEGVQKVYDLKGDVKLRGADLIWSKNADKMTNIDADLYWNNDEFVASFSNGRLGGLELQRGRAVIAPVLAKLEKTVLVTLTAKGGVGQAIDLLRQVGKTKFGSFDLSKIEADGEIEFSLESLLPLKEGAILAQRIQTLDATVSKGYFRNLPDLMDIENAELVMNFAEEKSQVTGTADVYGTPSEFSLDIDNTAGQVDLVAQITPSALLASAVAKMSGLDIAGTIGGKLVYSGDSTLRKGRVGLTADLRATSVNVPELDWAKLPAEDGRAIVTIVFRNGQMTSLQNIDLAAGSLSAQGQVAFGVSGQVQAAFFERVAWPGNDLRDLIIEQNANGVWNVGATAKLVNLVPLRRNEGVSGGQTLIFDFTADQIVVDEDIALSGQLAGKRDNSGIGSAEFRGMLSVHGKPWITEADMKMRFGPSEEMVTGTGLIGGGEASLTFQTSSDTEPKLVIKSENAGRVLSGLQVTDTVRGGKLWLTNSFKQDDFRSYDTTIELTKFRVVEAPRALRAFSVLSLAGLYSLVEGDGTAFQRGKAVLETRGPMVKISSMKASGEAVGVTMLGVFDRASKKIDVSGNLVPVNQINKLLGGLPILGDLITGFDKSGIFVTQFRVTGTSDDMKTSVNPVTSVAPGLIRDLFSPNWLGIEGKRLFGQKRDK